MEEGRGGHQEGPAQDRHHQPRTDHPGRAQGQGLCRGRQGHRPEDRPGRQHPGQQAGGEDHPPGGRDRQGAEGDGAGAGYPAGRLVLALLPAEPLALHAAHRHRRSSRARISPPGTCRACSPRSTSSSKRPSRPRRSSRPRPSAPGTTCCKRAPCRTATGPRSTISSPTRRWSSTPPASRPAAKPEDAFELSADSPILDSAEKFMAWQPAAGADTDSPVLKAIRLYQDLLRFHQNDPAPRLAFADADLERLTWGWNTAFGEDKNARYKAALEGVHRQLGRLSTSPPWPWSAEARVLQQEGDLVAARKLALRGAQAVPAIARRQALPQPGQRDRGQVAPASPPSGCGMRPGRRSPSATATSTRSISAPSRTTGTMFLREAPQPAREPERQGAPRNPGHASPRWNGRRSCRPPPTTRSGPAQLPAPDKPQAGLLFHRRQPRPEVRRDGQHRFHDRRLGERPGAGDADARRQARRLRAEGQLRRADRRRGGVRLASRQPGQPRRRPNADHGRRTASSPFKPSQNRGYLFRARHNGQELATASDIWAYGDHDRRAAPDGPDRLLHRPRDLPARPDDPIQRHLPLGGPGQGQLRGAQGRGADRGLPGRRTARRSPARSSAPTTTARSPAASPRRATG